MGTIFKEDCYRRIFQISQLNSDLDKIILVRITGEVTLYDGNGMVDLGSMQTAVIGLNAWCPSNARIVCITAVQSLRYLRFYCQVPDFYNETFKYEYYTYL